MRLAVMCHVVESLDSLLLRYANPNLTCDRVCDPETLSLPLHLSPITGLISIPLLFCFLYGMKSLHTILHVAVSTPDYKATERLLAYGADCHARTEVSALLSLLKPVGNRIHGFTLRCV